MPYGGISKMLSLHGTLAHSFTACSTANAQRFQLLFLVFLFVINGPEAVTPSSANPSVYDVDLQVDCGAVGDGVADDAGALERCLQSFSIPGRRRLVIPAGIYRIDRSIHVGPFSRGVWISGSGPAASVILLGRNFVGDLFAWSEAWAANHYGDVTLDVAGDSDGPSVSGLRIVGSRDSPGRQAALSFYDRNDFVTIRDLELDYLNGPCLSIGKTLRGVQGYMRESTFVNVKCWNSGSATDPAVEIGSTTADGSDATNELDIYKLAIFAAKHVGLSIRNPNIFGATRGIRFFGLRVEQSGGDDVQIAPAPDKGQVAGIRFYDLSALTSGGAALRIGGVGGKQPYAIAVHGGLLGPGNKTGIAIENGRLIDIELSGLDAPVVLGPGAGADITIHGNGSEYDWRFDGTRKPGEEAAPLNLRAPYGLYGLPNAGGRIGAAALKGQTSEGRPVLLTMDGKGASAYNCFNPGYAQAFNLDIQLMAVDRKAPDRFYAWRMPLSVLSAWTGASAAKFTPGEATARGVAGASVEVGPDTRAGCLSLVFSPPKGDTGFWDVTAALHFARAP